MNEDKQFIYAYSIPSVKDRGLELQQALLSLEDYFLLQRQERRWEAQLDAEQLVLVEAIHSAVRVRVDVAQGQCEAAGLEFGVGFATWSRSAGQWSVAAAIVAAASSLRLRAAREGRWCRRQSPLGPPVGTPRRHRARQSGTERERVRLRLHSFQVGCADVQRPMRASAPPMSLLILLMLLRVLSHSSPNSRSYSPFAS